MKFIKTIFLFVTLMMIVPAYSTEISGRAKDFTLASRSGKNIRLNEQIGQVVLVNFWASWCGPCREEMPKLEQLHQKYKDLGVTILGINIDENPQLAKKLLKDIKVTFPILYDPDAQVSEPYQVESMPSTYLIDKRGNLRFLHQGYKSGYEIKYDQQIKQLLRE